MGIVGSVPTLLFTPAYTSYRGFIKAETISYDDYVEYKGEQGAKEVGKMRQEGKEYITKDGDIFHFRFNV